MTPRITRFVLLWLVGGYLTTAAADRCWSPLVAVLSGAGLPYPVAVSLAGLAFAAPLVGYVWAVERVCRPAP